MKKPGRKPMYKNDAERKAARNESQKKYYLEKYKQKKHKSKLNTAASEAKERMHESAALARRIEELEKKAEALREENKEILLTLEEVLQDNKKFRDFHKYGIKPQLGTA